MHFKVFILTYIIVLSSNNLCVHVSESDDEEATSSGGALYVGYGSSLSVINTVFVNNSAGDVSNVGGRGYGGAAYFGEQKSVLISGCSL